MATESEKMMQDKLTDPSVLVAEVTGAAPLKQRSLARLKPLGLWIVRWREQNARYKPSPARVCLPTRGG